MTRLAPTKFRAALKSPTAGEIMTDRVIPLLSRLERAAIKINKAITKRNGSIQDWIDANIEMAEALIEARHDCGDNDTAFGVWCRHNGFTKDVLGKNERVALIDMGANPQKMREVLQKTERRSIPLIYKNEWACPNAGKGLKPFTASASHIANTLSSSKLQRPVRTTMRSPLHVGERAVRDVVEWGSLLVYSVLAYWLISFIVYWLYSL